MSHGIYAVANDTQLARTTLMRGRSYGAPGRRALRVYKRTLPAGGPMGPPLRDALADIARRIYFLGTRTLVPPM